ncbi:BNR-4 repeat-containing protein [Sphingobacterium gobiense]|uniref:Uncharacterized protein n=1 Tax=Sphingobacterium gobiense TaxID=1382456 RepID=A0A2S9JTJ0_9SPHI|nr:BNR-4 repeat-containing protein [Sphingobacterium gobiense]PRD56599.1 hypothetical protein C5749_05000 [Sphingobacterium gobiense]
MKCKRFFIYSAFIFVILGITTSYMSPEVNESDMQQNEWTPKFGGCGGIFFHAKEGPLTVEIEKTDLKADSRTRSLRATFIGPDRKVLKDIHTSEESEGKSLRLEAYVNRPGIYAVMVTISNDRYGENTSWRFRTNCDKYIIETSRGHKDQRHEEPIVLVDPEKETDLCFMPQRNGFNILITGLSDEVKKIELRDASDQHITFLEVHNDTAFHHVEEGRRLMVPWKLHFPKALAKVVIEGVTNWGIGYKSDFFYEYPGGAFWTPDTEKWFTLHDNRWLVTPYSHTSYDQSGKEQSAIFKVHNNGTTPKKVKLELEFPDEKWNIQLSHREILLDPNQEREVVLNWIGNDVDRSVHLRTICGDFSTYATLYSKAQKPDTDSSLQIPIQLEPYRHEQEQFGYTPDYPTNNQPYFNVDNMPFILSKNSVLSYQNSTWKETFTDRLQSSIAAFDSEGDMYVLGRDNNKVALLHSKDKGLTFKKYCLPGVLGTSCDIEQFTGHNMLEGPPPVIKYTRVGADKQHFWRRYGNLELFVPKKTRKGIEWEQPILISDKCLGVSSHSGLPSSVVSYKDKIFIVWGEITDVNISREKMPGVPVFVSMYDKRTKKLITPVLVGFGPPPNDTHNIPGITMDSEGYLHVLTGTHGRPFQYAKSLQPLSVLDGWTEAESLLDPKTIRSTQTYLGLVIDKENTLHTIFRYWQHNAEPFPDTHYATLAYMSKKQGEQWSEPKILVQAPLFHYSNFRHRLTIDRKGRLFISYDYWSTFWFYRNDRKYSERTLLMSPDGGTSWELVSGDNLVS